MHPDDLTFDFFIALMMEQFEANHDIPKSTYPGIEEELRNTYVPKMLSKRLDGRLASDQKFLKILNDIDWEASVKKKLTAKAKDDNALLSDLHIGMGMGSFKERIVPIFIYLLSRVLSELVDALPGKEGLLELSIDDLIPYVKYKMVALMKDAYIEYEHVYDAVLGDYISHMLPRVAELKKVEISILDDRSSSV